MLLLDKLIFYASKNSCIGYKRYMKQSYIFVTSYNYSALMPSLEPSSTAGVPRCLARTDECRPEVIGAKINGFLAPLDFYNETLLFSPDRSGFAKLLRKIHDR